MPHVSPFVLPRLEDREGERIGVHAVDVQFLTMSEQLAAYTSDVEDDVFFIVDDDWLLVALSTNRAGKG